MNDSYDYHQRNQELKPPFAKDVEPTPTVRVICAILILVPAMIGFTLQIVVTVAFCFGWKTMRNNSFYIIMIQIIGCNIYGLFLDIYLVFPLTLTGTQYMGDGVLLYRGPLFLEGVAYQGLLLLSFLLTVNRVAAFFFPDANGSLFSPRGTVLLSTIVWTYNITVVLLQYAFGCEKLFLKDEFHFRYYCAKGIYRFRFSDFMRWQNYVVPPIIIFLYILVYLKIKISYHGISRVNNSRVEMRFLLQTIPLGVLQSAQIYAFTAFPKLRVHGYERFFVTSATNLVTICVNMAPPIILLIYNCDIRKKKALAVLCLLLPIWITEGCIAATKSLKQLEAELEASNLFADTVGTTFIAMTFSCSLKAVLAPHSNYVGMSQTIAKAGFRILMCRPTYFTVSYAINPWMNVDNPVDTNKAVKQWEKVKETIEKCGAKVEVMEVDESAKDLPDLVFTANAGIVRGKKVYLANFTHEQRKPEWKINEKWFKENGFETFFNADIPHEGTGDALWINKGKILLAGIGPRSDIRAISDIRQKLRTDGDDFKVLAVRLVDERFYHLDTAICPLDDNLAIYFPKAFHPICQNNISNYLELLPVEESEAQKFACNSVVVGKNVIMNEGSEKIAKLLEKHGFKVHFVSMSEYLKSGGSAKCCTLRLDYDWFKK